MTSAGIEEKLLFEVNVRAQEQRVSDVEREREEEMDQLLDHRERKFILPQTVRPLAEASSLFFAPPFLSLLANVYTALNPFAE